MLILLWTYRLARHFRVRISLGPLRLVMLFVLVFALVVRGVRGFVDLVPHLEELGGVGLLELQQDPDERRIIRVRDFEHLGVKTRTMVVKAGTQAGVISSW